MQFVYQQKFSNRRILINLGGIQCHVSFTVKASLTVYRELTGGQDIFHWNPRFESSFSILKGKLYVRLLRELFIADSILKTPVPKDKGGSSSVCSINSNIRSTTHVGEESFFVQSPRNSITVMRCIPSGNSFSINHFESDWLRVILKPC